jgi:transcription-repair coupling factor (superfamily II helicase)
MRAAFKALGDGKQVAVLAPTTVLAFQHFESFKRRFAAFPVRIAMFSRFVPKKDLAVSVEELAQGKIDVAIGTHRLLSKDIEFRDLGLLVFDEEQRFGVRHKERLKQMRQNVDVLTMSATPIPPAHVHAGHPRHERDRDSAQRSPGDPDRGGAFRQQLDSHCH